MVKPKVKAFLIALFIGIAWLWVKTPPYLGPQHRVSIITNMNLAVAYESFNKEYFGKKLPLTDVKFGLAHGNLGETSVCATGLCIEINRSLNPANKQVYLTLAHEMCHVDTWGEREKDGPKWESCMHRLATEGAFDPLW